MKANKQEKSRGLFIKVASVYMLLLMLVLIFVVMIINRFCISFIKEQRMKYNTQILEMAAYEMKNVYNAIDSLLIRLCNEDRFSKTKMKLVMEGESTFEKIKREVDFVDSVKQATYANGLGTYYSGILFFNGADDSYYIGSGVILPDYSFQELAELISEERNALTILGPMKETYMRNADPDRLVFGFVRKTNEETGDIYSEANINNQYAMIIISQKELIGILEEVFLHEKGFYITNQNKELLYQSGLAEMGICPEELKIRSGSTQAGEKNVLLTSISLDAYGWQLSVVDEEKVLFEDVNRLMIRVVVFITAGSVLSIFLFLLITRKVLFPIAMLKKMIYQVAADNNTYLEVVSNDEAGEISQMINEMKHKIKGLTDNQYLLEMKTTEARLQLLQSQINPHFLYNTLDNIYCIAQVQEIEPITILTKNLSEMLRYGIDSKEMFVSLSEEIDYVKAYLNIINIRYEDRIQLELDIEAGTENCRIFKLLLQPLAENACLHGILPSQLKKGRIIIQSRRIAGDMIIEVRNSGLPIPAKRLELLNDNLNHAGGALVTGKHGFGIALGNINERLKLFYGPAYGITILAIGRWGTCVQIRVRFKK